MLDNVACNAGAATTVTPTVSLNPLDVAVMIAEPILTPATSPLFESTLATAGALLDM